MEEISLYDENKKSENGALLLEIVLLYPLHYPFKKNMAVSGQEIYSILSKNVFSSFIFNGDYGVFPNYSNYTEKQKLN